MPLAAAALRASHCALLTVASSAENAALHAMVAAPSVRSRVASIIVSVPSAATCSEARSAARSSCGEEAIVVMAAG